MNYEEYVEMGINGDAPLKVIMCGSVMEKQGVKHAAVSIVYATMDKTKAEKRMEELGVLNQNEDYYMVYSVPLDMDLTELEHYPSIAIAKNDLL